MTREEWLNLCVDRLRPMFEDSGAKIPEKVRVSCGWPSVRALATGNRRVGECWSPIASADQTSEIFISPALSEGGKVAGVLVHELVHAAVGNDAGHRAPFSRLAKKLGLQGPWTATTPSEELSEKLTAMMPEPYPHAVLNRSARKKDGTRMLKVICPDCGYTVRTTQKWLDAGLPRCPCGTEMEEAYRGAV